MEENYSKMQKHISLKHLMVCDLVFEASRMPWEM